VVAELAARTTSEMETSISFARSDSRLKRQVQGSLQAWSRLRRRRLENPVENRRIYQMFVVSVSCERSKIVQIRVEVPILPKLSLQNKSCNVVSTNH